MHLYIHVFEWRTFQLLDFAGLTYFLILNIRLVHLKFNNRNSLVVFVCVSTNRSFQNKQSSTIYFNISSVSISNLYCIFLTFSAIFSFSAHVKTDSTRYGVTLVRMLIPIIRQDLMYGFLAIIITSLLVKSRKCHGPLAQLNWATTFKQAHENVQII